MTISPESEIIRQAQMAVEKGAEFSRPIFEKWCISKGISVSKNQRIPVRWFTYHNRNTRQLWKLWKQIVTQLTDAGIVQSGQSVKLPSTQQTGGRDPSEPISGDAD